MKIIERNSLRRGGFAGLRETRMVMNPRLFRGYREAGTSSGIGRFCYLADARFLPYGETRMHTHHDIDVISVVVEGRLHHEGSLQDGEQLGVDDVQVQRAGSEGFSHNEINPDNFKNRMIQLWVIPETNGQPVAYRKYHAQAGKRTRVYGGPTDQGETIAAHTIIDIAHINAGDRVSQPGRVIAYIISGKGHSGDETIKEGDLIDTRDFNFKPEIDSKLLLIYEM